MDTRRHVLKSGVRENGPRHGERFRGKGKVTTLAVQIMGWSKRQPRKDVAVSSWFRMDHAMFFDPDWDDFSAEEHHVWVWLLAYASFKNRSELLIEVEACARRAKVSAKVFHSAIEKLEKKGSISITSRERNVDVTDTSRGRALQDKTGQDKTDTVPSGTVAPSDSALSLLPVDDELLRIFVERGVTPKHQAAWRSAFPDDSWVISEIRKALAWELTNPQRQKKNFAAFITRWLTKGWDRRRVETRTEGRPIDWDRVFDRGSA